MVAIIRLLFLHFNLINYNVLTSQEVGGTLIGEDRLVVVAGAE
jgi:hypothetical protein